jgi:hypothetical protein
MSSSFLAFDSRTRLYEGEFHENELNQEIELQDFSLNHGG